MKRTPLNARRDKIFGMVVESYIETAEPVGSRAISRRAGVGLSSASVRNIMADLEEAGLLMQPHTSAGRVPTDRGYRYYVDSLMEPEEISDKERQRVAQELWRAKTIEGLASRVSKLIAELTNNAALLYIKNLRRVSFLHDVLQEMIDAQRLSELMEDEPGIFIEGASRIFGQPEFQDIQKIRPLLRVFDEKNRFVQIFVRDLGADGVHIHIGHENTLDDLEDVSLVSKDCYIEGSVIGGVAVLGPKRMRYSKVISVVSHVADTVSRVMEERF